MKAFRAFVGGLSGKRLVGQDKAGNKYFVIEQKGENVQERRSVEYAGDVDPHTLHPLWRGWLHHSFRKFPTEKEIDRWEADQRELKRRVRDLEEADAKLRLEEAAQRMRDGTDYPESYSASNFLQQMTMRMKAEEAPTVDEMSAKPQHKLFEPSVDPSAATSEPSPAKESQSTSNLSSPPNSSIPGYAPKQQVKQPAAEAWNPNARTPNHDDL